MSDQALNDAMSSVMAATKIELDRVREILTRREALPGEMTWFGAFWMRTLVTRAEKAIKDRNVIECASVLIQLREVEG